MDNGSDTSNRSNNFLNVYDAVWSIAFVLDQSRDELLKQGKTLENLTYGDTNATAVFRTLAEKLDFRTPNIGVREMECNLPRNRIVILFGIKVARKHAYYNVSCNRQILHFSVAQSLHEEKQGYWLSARIAATPRVKMRDLSIAGNDTIHCPYYHRVMEHTRMEVWHKK